MTESLMKLVHRVRIGIYLALLIVVAIIGISKIVHKVEASDPQAFWPPDMVPHPMPPENPPADDNMA